MAILSREVKVGDEVPSLVRRATMPHRKDVQSGPGTIHDDEFTKSLGYSGGGFVAGTTTLAYVAEQLRNLFGEGWVKGGRISVSFPKPVFHGDMLTIKGVVKEKVHEGDAMRLVLDLWAEKPTGEKVLEGTASGIVP